MSEPQVGDHVKVFDSRLFVDDVKTPLSVTMKAAVITKIYNLQEYNTVCDVIFDHDNRKSKGHFISLIQALGSSVCVSS